MKSCLAPWLCAALLVTTTNAFALAGELKEPGVAHAQGYPQAAQQQVMAALKRAGCKFLKGHFLNSHTSLLYAGETKALNLFLDAHSNRFHVRVNLKSERIKLPDLYLPEVKGPSVVTAPKAQ